MPLPRSLLVHLHSLATILIDGPLHHSYMEIGDIRGNMFSLLTILSHVVWLGFASYRQIKIDGDFVIGGLFPVHEQGDHGQSCGQLSEGRGIHRVEAMLFALDKINSDPVLLPGIKLGARILDSCSNPSHALNLSLVFVRELMGAELHQYRCQDGSQPALLQVAQPVAGVIGGSYSGVSVQTAHLLRLFEIVQISPASTNADLSDKTRFNFFARTVPSDIYQARAMADLARRYNWTYLSLVYSSGEYGEALTEAFKIQARRMNICVALEEKISKRAQARQIVQRLTDAVVKPDRGPRAVVLFTRNDDTRAILQQASLLKRRHPRGTKLQWLASDGWEIGAITTQGSEDAAADAIIISLEARRVPEFNKHFLSLHPANPLSYRNEWFAEFWELKHNCSINPSFPTVTVPTVSYDYGGLVEERPTCRPTQRLTNHEFQSDDKVPFVIDAVYALAHALHEMWREYCLGVAGVCPALRRIDGRVLYQSYLLNVSFKGLVDNQFRFDGNGDGPANYRFMNYQLLDEKKGKYDYVEVGRWRQGVLNIEDEKMSWLATASGTGQPPISICNPDCPIGQRKEHMQKGETCCWACIPCASHQFMTDEATCTDCPDGHWPDEERKSCFALPVEHMQWDSAYSIVASSLASVGIVMALQVIMVYAKYWDTPVIKASGRELSCVLLTGVILCFCTTYVILAKPTKLVCGLRRVGVGLGFAILYSATLVKTNRIYRIFTYAQMAKRCRFISPASQLVIAGILISVQLLASLIWLAIEPPSVKLVYPSRSQVVSRCAQEDHWFLVSLTYDCVLIIMCTVFAVKTRLVPENFNEAKFIGFTMYTTCIIWLAFLPLYFGTEGDFKIQLTTLSICVTLSATVALLCLYAPKLWIVLFEPEKNVRRPRSASTFGSHWAMLLPDPNMYTPLLAIRAAVAGGTQNVFLAPPNFAEALRERKVGPRPTSPSPVENGTTVTVHTSEHTSEIAELCE